MINTAVILAAGKGTRLQANSLRHSKAMTPILGVPIAIRVIEGFARAGLTDFIVVRASDDLPLENACSNFKSPGISIRTAVQEKIIGTAHALMMARDLIRGDFLLASCDNLFPDAHVKKMLEEHRAFKPPAVLTLEKVSAEKLISMAAVRMDGSNIIDIIEKPARNPGTSTKSWDAVAKFLFTFDRKILNYLDKITPSPSGEYELQDALKQLMNDSPTCPRGVFSDGNLHLTAASDLIEIHKYYLERHRPYAVHPSARVHPAAKLIEPFMVDADAEISAGAILGPYVYVGEGAFIGEEAQVSSSVIYAGARVEAGLQCREQIITMRKDWDT